ncbi:MAG: hypothetical protein AAFQ67_02690, partial [Pseudomonadota bacterium]
MGIMARAAASAAIAMSAGVASAEIKDTVVPYDQADQFRKVAKDRPWFSFDRLDGEDHYLYTTSAREAMLSKTLEFLA